MMITHIDDKSKMHLNFPCGQIEDLSERKESYSLLLLFFTTLQFLDIFLFARGVELETSVSGSSHSIEGVFFLASLRDIFLVF